VPVVTPTNALWSAWQASHEMSKGVIFANAVRRLINANWTALPAMQPIKPGAVFANALNGKAVAQIRSVKISAPTDSRKMVRVAHLASAVQP